MDTLNNVQQKSAFAAIQITGLDHGHIAPIIRGAANVHPVGVLLAGGHNTHIEVNCTGLRSTCLVGGALLVANGVRIVRAGPFGADNLASGVMA